MISIVINADTRPIRNAEHGLSKGVVNRDFLLHGVVNKIKFFEGFPIEVILHVDEHEPVPNLSELTQLCDTIIVRKHTDEPKFNDYNYLRAMSLASGEYVAHFDMDTAAFTESPKPIKNMLAMLEHHDFISYPSHWSPDAVHDDSFDYRWASTRFFICKREKLNTQRYRELLADYVATYEAYPASRKCHWTEHIIGLVAKYDGKGVYYPPIVNDHLIFSWGSYTEGTIQQLQQLSFDEVVNYVNARGGIHYPNDVHG